MPAIVAAPAKRMMRKHTQSQESAGFCKIERPGADRTEMKAISCRRKSISLVCIFMRMAIEVIIIKCFSCNFQPQEFCKQCRFEASDFLRVLILKDVLP